MKNGQLQGYEYLDDFNEQCYSGPYMTFEDKKEQLRMWLLPVTAWLTAGRVSQPDWIYTCLQVLPGYAGKRSVRGKPR